MATFMIKECYLNEWRSQPGANDWSKPTEQSGKESICTTNDEMGNFC